MGQCCNVAGINHHQENYKEKGIGCQVQGGGEG